MNKVPFQAYAIDFDAAGYQTSGLPPGVKLSHTFVTSPKYNWNCFGRGKPDVNIATALPSGSGSAYEEWAHNIYGAYEGDTNEIDPAAGLHVRYDGVCHNAANRVLVLADADVSDADGDAIVILMYGKYGFGMPAYIDSVKAAAAKVNADANQSVISDDEVNAVIARITGDASTESDTLEQELLKKYFDQKMASQGLTPDQANGIRQVYSAFQTRRQEIFTETQAKDPDDRASFQGEYASAMKGELVPTLQQIKGVLGDAKYLDIFKVEPEVAAAFLLG